MAFEVFKKSSAPLARVPSVTIQKAGLFSINRAAWALIGQPPMVELLFDKERRVIALRPAAEDNPNAYPARAQSAKDDKGPILVAGLSFLQFYKIAPDASRRWQPFVEEGMLCVDLRQEGVEVRSNRSGRAPEGSTADN